MVRNTFFSKFTGKNGFLKKHILETCLKEKQFLISDLNKEFGTSHPTVARIVNSMIEDGYLVETGKSNSSSGRKPMLYGLNPDAGYFVGVDVHDCFYNIAVTNFIGDLIFYKGKRHFSLVNTEESCRKICDDILELLKGSGIDSSMFYAFGFNFTGRVNNTSGYCFSYFISEDKPIAKILENRIGHPVFVENDSRAIAYAEYIHHNSPDDTLLAFNISWGLGMGMIVDGKLSYGHSGYSGEIGHFPLLDNRQICRCGKIGCLETGVSGSALHRIIKEQLQAGQPSKLSKIYESGQDVSLSDIIHGMEAEDTLTIEVIEEMGNTLGRVVSGLINLFNPDCIIIGGTLACMSKYLIPPMKTTINKLALGIVSNDTDILVSKLGSKAGALGASYIARGRLFGII